MAKKGFRKGSTDKKQTKRIKQLENFVYKTIENKQINFQASNINITTSGFATNAFLRVDGGVEDGGGLAAPARIGDSVTLMNQRINVNLKMRLGADDFNQIRMIVCESTEGAEALALSDILEYSSFALYGDMVFSSPYTTKTTTNKRYKIHSDKTFTLTKVNNPCKSIKMNIKYKGGKVVNFDGPLNELPTNHRLQMLLISDSGAVQHPRLDYAIRSTYKDA